ncbi:GntR family transcriptional regulator [Paenarthrobacter sp. MSM-2-10-13]|uniref:GntR family transcriptional regulator n=1 Tax=Micrococcaceae TaxID=1268 RepID=UPI0014248D16|nr:MULTISPECIES: GntR family transcriptional regulator [Micrococcaceae]NHW46369.1 GntR family transcriptional regulator [Paenarthrobacter sp. MSM-2-10-13]BCW63124.1 HTH-type transcriptional repressor DasR [Arthrobacter sp. StoSoilB22]
MSSNVSPSTPKYYLLKTEVLGLIAGQRPGTLIPTERALAEKYATSRTTVRQAISELVAEGKLGRIQGHGTFVAPPKVTHVRQLTSFSDDARTQGLRPDSKLLALDVLGSDAEVAAHLGIDQGKPVTRLERIRLIEGEPLAHEVAWLPAKLPRFKSQLAKAGSLYAALADVYGIRIADVEDTVETALAGPAEVRLLGIEMGAPLLLVHRLARDAVGAPVEWTRSAFRGDRFRFVSRVRSGN